MRHNILGQLSLSNLPEENRLPADWGPRMRYPLLRFTISPLFEGQLVSVLQFYTLQTDRRLCLVLENIAGDGQAEVTVPAGSPVGFVTQAGVAEVLEDETAKAEKWQQYKMVVNNKACVKRRRGDAEADSTLDRGGQELNDHRNGQKIPVWVATRRTSAKWPRMEAAEQQGGEAGSRPPLGVAEDMHIVLVNPRNPSEIATRGLSKEHAGLNSELEMERLRASPVVGAPEQLSFMNFRAGSSWRRTAAAWPLSGQPPGSGTDRSVACRSSVLEAETDLKKREPKDNEATREEYIEIDDNHEEVLHHHHQGSKMRGGTEDQSATGDTQEEESVLCTAVSSPWRRPNVEAGMGKRTPVCASANQWENRAENSKSSSSSCPVGRREAAAYIPVLLPKSVVAFAKDERPEAKAPARGGGGGGILCLDVETITDGAYSQFTQIGAVLSLGGGQTFTFGAQVSSIIDQ